MRTLLLAIVVAISFPLLSQNSWTDTDGPYGYSLPLDVVEFNGRLYATHRCGVFMQTPVGEWTKVSNFLVDHFKLDNSKLHFTQMNQREAFFLPANATSWSPQRVNPANSPFHLYDFKGNLKIYASQYNGAAYTFGNPSFFTWLQTGLVFDTINTTPQRFGLETYDVKIGDSIVYLLTKNGLYTSDFRFNQWQLQNSSLANKAGAQMAYEDSTLFVWHSKKLWMSTDEGISFQTVNTFGSDINSFEKVDSLLFVGTESGAFSYKTGDASWTLMNTGLTISHTRIFEPDTGVIMCATPSEALNLWNGAQWTAINNDGMYCSTITGLAEKDSVVYANTPSQLFKRVPGSFTWDEVFGQDTITMEAIVKADSLLMIPAQVDSTTPAYVLYSADPANGWNKFEVPFAVNNAAELMLAADGNRWFIAYDDILMITTDKGQTFSNYDQNFPFNPCTIDDIAFYDGKLYLANCQDRHIMSRSRFGNWQSKLYVNLSFTAKGRFHKMDHGLLYFSNDAVMELTELNDFRYVGSWPGILAEAANYNEHFYALSDDDRLYYSPDTALSWTNIALSGIKITSMACTNNSLYVGTPLDGVMKYDVPFSVFSEKETAFTTHHNLNLFPNPASDKVTVKIDHLNFKEFNYQIIGINAEIVQKGALPMGGEIDVEALKPGEYLLILQSSDQSYSGKLLIGS